MSFKTIGFTKIISDDETPVVQPGEFSGALAAEQFFLIDFS